MSKALNRMTHGGGRPQDAEYLVRIADNIPGGRTLCAFGEACSWPVQSFVAKFKDEFVAKGAADEERRSRGEDRNGINNLADSAFNSVKSVNPVP